MFTLKDFSVGGGRYVDGDGLGISEAEAQEEVDFLNKVDQGYVGITKPKTVLVKVDDDKYIYQRWQAAKKLGVSPDELADEPDEMSDHSDDQGWDIEEEK